MKQITVKMPEWMIQEIDEQIKVAGYPSRAELIRELTRNWLNQRRMIRNAPPIRR
jgi:Arc/MetJ-type ribon-helix-helix transcriptional regulator